MPLNVVVSGSGAVDLNEPNFHHPGLRVLIATTNAGGARLAQQELPDKVTALVVEGSADGRVAPGPLLAALWRDYGVRLALHEGGPSLFTSFLRADCLDELFLTLAPQFAGRADDSQTTRARQGLRLYTGKRAVERPAQCQARRRASLPALPAAACAAGYKPGVRFVSRLTLH